MSGNPTNWHRSTYCANTHCVEVAADGDDILVRDGKDVSLSPLRVSKQAWHRFLDDIVTGKVCPPA